MSEIKPALTAEEWENPAAVELRGRLTTREAPTPEEVRHAVAAHALRGQPFGFTWEHVEALTEYADILRENGFDDAEIRDVSNRIAALLPPR